MVTKRLDGSWTRMEPPGDNTPSMAIGLANYGQRTRRKRVEEITPILPTPTTIPEEAA